MGRSGSTTNGIKKWNVNKADKPEMNDFNSVIDEVSAQLSNKANANDVNTALNLKLPGKWQSSLENTDWKTLIDSIPNISTACYANIGAATSIIPSGVTNGILTISKYHQSLCIVQLISTANNFYYGFYGESVGGFRGWKLVAGTSV